MFYKIVFAFAFLTVLVDSKPRTPFKERKYYLIFIAFPSKNNNINSETAVRSKILKRSRNISVLSVFIFLYYYYFYYSGKYFVVFLFYDILLVRVGKNSVSWNGSIFKTYTII